jgi:MSHA biogenesis protein MshI
MFQRQTRPGWMAIDLRPASLRVAHVVRVKGGVPRLALLRGFERNGSDADDLGRLRRSLGLQNYRCTTSADASSYQIVQMNTPTVPKDEMRGALRWGVKDALDFPVDDALIEALEVPADGAAPGRGRLVLAVAARRDRMTARVQAFQRSGVPLKVIDIAEAAQRNLASLFEQRDRALAFLAFDEHGGLLTFTRNGELYAVRHIEATTKALADAAPAPARLLVFERIALELQRSLDNFDRLFSQLALQRVLVAPHDGCAALVAHLRENLTPLVETAELGSVFDCDADASLGNLADQAGWLRPLGLALRDEGASAPHVA